MTRAWPWLLLPTSRHPYTRPLNILASIFRHTFLRVLSFLQLPPTSSISPPELSLCLSVTKTLSLSLSRERCNATRALLCDTTTTTTKEEDAISNPLRFFF